MDMNRRELLEKAGKFIILSGAARVALEVLQGEPSPDVDKYKMAEHWWAMTIDVSKCIGCGNCVKACAEENGVPKGYFRTWVERYYIPEEDMERPEVDSPDGGYNGFPAKDRPEGKSFFVPKLCNHCKDSPCVQACPVGATYESPDGVVLVDEKYCIGCRYCIQACPYGCRYLHPTKHTVDKCTLCYHRITQGLTTACCEVCPTGARQLADLKNPKDPVHEFLRSNHVQVLKPHLATGAKVFYKDLDGSVR
jgi:Fe-S-cluster-containing dehydrogenase component